MVINTTILPMQYRSAFTMIELIFAIVVIGITMLTIPLVMVQDAKQQEDSLMQEGIMLSATKIAQALTFQWANNSSDSGVASLISKSQVLNTGGDGELFLRRAAPNNDFRIGHFPEKLRRRLTPASNPRAAGAIGGNVIPATNINSFNGETDVIPAGDPQYSFKKQWTVTAAVSYVSDTATYLGTTVAGSTTVNYNFPTSSHIGTTNIKMVRVTATDGTTTTLGATGNQVVLTSYSCNIGEAEFYKRRY